MLTHSTHTHRTQAHRQAMEVDKGDAIITSPDKKRTKVDKPGDEDDDDVSIPPVLASACPLAVVLACRGSRALLMRGLDSPSHSINFPRTVLLTACVAGV